MRGSVVSTRFLRGPWFLFWRVHYVTHGCSSFTYFFFREWEGFLTHFYQGNVFCFDRCFSTGWGWGGFPACITGHMTRGICLQAGLHPGGPPPGEGVLHLRGLCRRLPPGLPTGELGRHPPSAPRYMGYGQQAGGTHPTGMHSCFNIDSCIVGQTRDYI